eukprot:CAMPEP_0118969862 /NCGR_PEP_ID=MMETSP1173-20130426/6884_1 /TAXON_ID=1034831 /ORGANISM="Rhizochromulina marina cf, Strain CCMP1243" /LENGTH=95 /DNA_ID=CAMNT_0006919151 /DNA_START=133 /DNA_END=420 /DNA_ORIENTATION=+
MASATGRPQPSPRVGSTKQSAEDKTLATSNRDKAPLPGTTSTRARSEAAPAPYTSAANDSMWSSTRGLAPSSTASCITYVTNRNTTRSAGPNADQ